MTDHANKDKVTQISLPKAGCELDRLEWPTVERLIKKVCAQSNLTITVYDQNNNEESQLCTGPTETSRRSIVQSYPMDRTGKSANITKFTRTF